MDIPTRLGDDEVLKDQNGDLIGFVEHWEQGGNRYDIRFDSERRMVVMKYSVVKIIEAMRGIGKYEQFRAMIESARLDWDFIGANYMSEDHPAFVRMCAALVDGGIVAKAQLDEMLPKCVWTAE